jgi:murein DD-endopeptidase MepM/ murein hydrolase activator NlpD
VTRRGGFVILGLSTLVACLCAALIAWRLGAMHLRKQATTPAAPSATLAFNPRAPSKTSPIIDSPGDPVVIRRGAVSAPKDALIGVPAKLGEEPKALAKAYFINSLLVSTTGGYMGKFQDAGSTADVLALQFAVNSEDSGNLTQAQIDAGSDDDGGADTPADIRGAKLTSANSNQLEIRPAGSQGRPLIREMVLRTPVEEKISDLLIANGYSEGSARSIENAAKDSSKRIDTLPPQSVVLAVGALGATGDYGAKQIAIFEGPEYVITIAAEDNGGYDEAAEPLIPHGLLEDSGGTADAARHYTLADGVYSAGLRNGAPEAVVREAIELIHNLLDLSSPLQADETIRLLFETNPRDKAKSMGRVIYVGLRGAAISGDCYSFEGSGGFFRCFDPKAASESKNGESKGRPLPLPSLGSSGATSVGGILAPIRGAQVTSLFGMRFHPILHILRLHAGIDFGAPVGSQVRAAADGTIEFAGLASGFGNHVRIKHAGFETSYSHLSEIPDLIKPGVAIKEGDVIALSGNTGLSTGPHLHFEFYLNGEAVDPLPHLGEEFQSAAATLAPSPILAVPGLAGGFSSATMSEIKSFPAIKAYIDDEVARLMK